MDTIIRTILIGVGATIIMDLWAFVLRIFKIQSLDYRLLGRWIAYFPKGKFTHNKIFNSPAVKNELVLGWIAHYLIGISFAFLLLAIYGNEWLKQPTLSPALLIGIVTVVAPLFIMQPAFGFGVASSKLPRPNIIRLKSLVTHSIYGIGLYVSTILLK